MKKFLAALLASMMIASVAVGCGGGNDSSSDDGDDTPATEAPKDDDNDGDVEPEPAPETLSGDLKVAVRETAYGSEVWEKVVEEFNKIYPDVNVELTIDANLETILDPQFQAGQWVDVVHQNTGINGVTFTEDMRDSMLLRDITNALENTLIPGENVTVAQKVIPGFTDSKGVKPYADGKTYFAPMFYSPCGLFYNANLLEDNGWTFPTTWDEMWELGDKALEEGIYLFTYPTSGYLDAFLTAVIATQGGTEMFNDAMNYKGWETPEMLEVLELVSKLASYTEPTTVGNANNTSFAMNQQLVIDGKAICMPNGTWIVGEMEDTTPDDFVWGFSAVPSMNPANAPVSFTFFETLWSPKDAPNPENADAFIAFLYSDVAVDIFASVDAVQPVVGVVDKLSEANQLFYSVYDNGAAAITGGWAATNPVDGVNITAAAYDNINKIVAGEITPEQWQDEIVAAADQLRPELI